MFTTAQLAMIDRAVKRYRDKPPPVFYVEPNNEVVYGRDLMRWLAADGHVTTQATLLRKSDKTERVACVPLTPELSTLIAAVASGDWRYQADGSEGAKQPSVDDRQELERRNANQAESIAFLQRARKELMTEVVRLRGELEALRASVRIGDAVVGEPATAVADPEAAAVAESVGIKPPMTAAEFINRAAHEIPELYRATVYNKDTGTVNLYRSLVVSARTAAEAAEERRKRVEWWAAEVAAVLDKIPKAYRIASCEGGGQENIAASLALSVAKMRAALGATADRDAMAADLETCRKTIRELRASQVERVAISVVEVTPAGVVLSAAVQWANGDAESLRFIPGTTAKMGGVRVKYDKDISGVAELQATNRRQSAELFDARRAVEKATDETKRVIARQIHELEFVPSEVGECLHVRVKLGDGQVSRAVLALGGCVEFGAARIGYTKLDDARQSSDTRPPNPPEVAEKTPPLWQHLPDGPIGRIEPDELQEVAQSIRNCEAPSVTMGKIVDAATRAADRGGILTDDERAKLRAMLAAEYRNPVGTGKRMRPVRVLVEDAPGDFPCLNVRTVVGTGNPDTEITSDPVPLTRGEQLRIDIDGRPFVIEHDPKAPDRVNVANYSQENWIAVVRERNRLARELDDLRKSFDGMRADRDAARKMVENMIRVAAEQVPPKGA